MKLYFRQRLFSWLDSYDVFDEQGRTVFTVQGKLDWGHRLEISDAGGNHVGTVRQILLSLLPRFDIYLGETCIGSIKKELTFIKPKFTVDVNGWTVEGNWLEWDYEIRNSTGSVVASVSKEIFNLTDTYTIDVAGLSDVLPALMVVLAIDAEKCSRD